MTPGATPLLRIAPREAGHHNNYTNWRVRSEHELIYALNASRRFPDEPARAARLRRQMIPMIWRMRAQAVLACVRHAKFEAAWKGLEFMANRIDFAAEATPDSVVDWQKAAELLQE